MYVVVVRRSGSIISMAGMICLTYLFGVLEQQLHEFVAGE